MKNVSMRFCGYTFHHNPATLVIDRSGNIRELTSPCCTPAGAHLGSRLTHISGEGELYGADCIRQYRLLEKLHDSEKAGLLSLPHMPPMTAYLKELRMTAQPKENVLGYRFEFVEAEKPAADDMTDDSYMTQTDGESLWDVSYLYGVGIDTLVRLNPQIKRIDALSAGEKVRLC